MSPSSNSLLLLLYACISRKGHGHQSKPKSLGIGEKAKDKSTAKGSQKPTDNKRDSAMLSPISSEDSELSSKQRPVVSLEPLDEKCASSPVSPRPARMSASRDLTARRPSPTASSELPPDHVPDEAEIERRRRGDAQPQVVPFDLIEPRRSSSRTASIKQVVKNRDPNAAGAGIG